jgi:uncharacterized damage-inducible protein DinB
MRDYFIRLFEFDAWANQAVLESTRTCPVVPKQVEEWLGHILIAQQFVYEILQGRDGSPLQERPAPALDECAQLIADLAASWRNYLDDISDAEMRGTITFRNSRGDMVTRRITDLLAHAVNHATYHRGQIALEVRAAGGEPARTDIPVWAGRQTTNDK